MASNTIQVLVDSIPYDVAPNTLYAFCKRKKIFLSLFFGKYSCQTLYDKVKLQTNITPDYLSYNNIRLDVTKLISSYNFVTGSKISSYIQVFIKGIEGKSMALFICLENTYAFHSLLFLTLFHNFFC